ncbi:hypothetical protein BC829DRAFT_235586 [Chytridium lagenaria]|nr:hypothetical protein BC829DRAFT_235586 [Chytridium lagenaria]
MQPTTPLPPPPQLGIMRQRDSPSHLLHHPLLFIYHHHHHINNHPRQSIIHKRGRVYWGESNYHSTTFIHLQILSKSLTHTLHVFNINKPKNKKKNLHQRWRWHPRRLPLPLHPPPRLNARQRLLFPHRCQRLHLQHRRRHRQWQKSFSHGHIWQQEHAGKHVGAREQYHRRPRVWGSWVSVKRCASAG